MRALITLEWPRHPEDRFIDRAMLEQLAARLRSLTGHVGPVEATLYAHGSTLADRVRQLEAENRELREHAGTVSDLHLVCRAEQAIWQEVCESNCALAVAARRRG